MAYGKISVSALLSDNSDYSNPIVETSGGAYTFTSDYHSTRIINVPTASSIATNLAEENWSSVEAILVKNLSTTTGTGTYVDFQWYDHIATLPNPGGDAIDWIATNELRDQASGSTFAGVQVGDRLYNDNALDSANRGLDVVATRTNDEQITVENTITADVDDTTVTFKHLRKNRQRIFPGRWLVIPGNLGFINTGTDLYELEMLATGSACKVEITAFGS